MNKEFQLQNTHIVYYHNKLTLGHVLKIKSAMEIHT